MSGQLPTKRTALQHSGSDSKRVRNQSKDAENGLTAIFLYLGVFKFLRFEVRLRNERDTLPDTLKINSVFDPGQLISDNPRIRQHWNIFLKEIKVDNEMFSKFFPFDLRYDEAVDEDYFMLHNCEELTYYIYCYNTWQRCCESKWQYWREVFLAHNNLIATNLDFAPCNVQHNCYLNLSPYFWDNTTIENYLKKYLQNCTVTAQATNMKDMLYLAKENNDKEGMFAYKEDFGEDGTNWDENVWSKRLGACIEKCVVKSSYTVEYTAEKGKQIFDKRQFYHRFHGAPDLTIWKSDDEKVVATTDTTSEGSDDNENSQHTPVGTLENSVQVEEKYKDSDGKFRDSRLNMTILEKSGELIANMHVMLVKKC